MRTVHMKPPQVLRAKHLVTFVTFESLYIMFLELVAYSIRVQFEGGFAMVALEVSGLMVHLHVLPKTEVGEEILPARLAYALRPLKMYFVHVGIEHAKELVGFSAFLA